VGDKPPKIATARPSPVIAIKEIYKRQRSWSTIQISRTYVADKYHHIIRSDCDLPHIASETSERIRNRGGEDTKKQKTIENWGIVGIRSKCEIRLAALFRSHGEKKLEREAGFSITAGIWGKERICIERDESGDLALTEGNEREKT
jgi:hypothetical protein